MVEERAHNHTSIITAETQKSYIWWPAIFNQLCKKNNPKLKNKMLYTAVYSRHGNKGWIAVDAVLVMQRKTWSCRDAGFNMLLFCVVQTSKRNCAGLSWLSPLVQIVPISRNSIHWNLQRLVVKDGRDLSLLFSTLGVSWMEYSASTYLSSLY